jgi:hypothetical protein
MLSEGWPNSVELNQAFNSLVKNCSNCWGTHSMILKL